MKSTNLQIYKSTNRRGFTLIELIVVMLILAILVTLGLGAFRSSQTKSRDSKRKGEVKNIASALELYYSDYGKYPNDGPGTIVACGATGTSVCNWGSAFIDQNGTYYMTKLPTDPKSGYTYYYDVGTSNKSFQLYARLENTEDADVPKSGSTPQAYQNLSCGVKLCNYGIASTNTTPEEGRILVNE